MYLPLSRQNSGSRTPGGMFRNWVLSSSTGIPSHWRNGLGEWDQWAVPGSCATLASSGFQPMEIANSQSKASTKVQLLPWLSSGWSLICSGKPVPRTQEPCAITSFSIAQPQSPWVSEAKHQPLGSLPRPLQLSAIKQQFQDVPFRGRWDNSSRPSDALVGQPSDLHLSSWWIIYTVTEI